MASLRMVRKKAGYSQRELAELIGTSQPNIAHYESGKKVFSMKIANKVIREIGERNATGSELVLGNRLAAFKRAKGEGDLPGMLDSAKAVSKTLATTPEAMGLLKEMVGTMEEATGDHDDLDGDGRDLFGRVRPAMKNADSEEDDRDVFGRVLPDLDSGDEEDFEDEYEDDEDELDGDRRDVFGRRIGA